MSVSVIILGALYLGTREETCSKNYSGVSWQNNSRRLIKPEHERMVESLKNVTIKKLRGISGGVICLMGHSGVVETTIFFKSGKREWYLR